MGLYIDADLITDETTVTEALLTAMADRINAALDLAEDEEWEPQEGSPETSFSEAVGVVLATAMSLVQDQERNDFAAFGRLILSTDRDTAEQAQTTGRWLFGTGGAHFIPDGSEVVIDTAAGDPVAFATVGDTAVVDATEVDILMVAVEPGAIGNGLTGSVREWAPIPQAVGVTLLGLSSEGADEEERDAYLERVVRRARRMKIVPVITDDYADTAIDHPSVARAVAVRLLDADAPTDPPDSPGHVTVYVADEAGGDLSEETRLEVRDSMRGEDRPLAVTVHVLNPTRTDVTIALDVRLAADADEAATVAAVQDAIAAAFGPARYGLDETAAGRWRAPRTDAERTINAYDVAAAVDDIPGVAKIEAVTVNGGASVTLTGWAPLPNLTAPAAVTVL